ncbi:MAG: DUF72 domain-containing protein [Thaumarchaeota archaeon]|nr:DUF72 domain-containing protein [Nitrososphaerota archaeon]
MVDLRIGTSGWVYDFWVGGFYPRFTKPSDYLKTYSKIFNIVEIDNSFYRFPTRETVKQWAEETPDDFIFTAKVHRRITAEKRLHDCGKDLEYMYRVFEPMVNKLGAFVFQFPPGFTFAEGIEKLGRIIPTLDSRFKYAMEFRDDSWFRKETYELLKSSKITLAWSEIPTATNPAVTTTDWVYLRFIGERDIPEGKLGEVRRDLEEQKAKWAKRVQDQLNSVRSAYIFFNNRFEGFGPGSVNSFRKLMGLQEIDFKKLNLGSQQTLFDFTQK